MADESAARRCDEALRFPPWFSFQQNSSTPGAAEARRDLCLAAPGIESPCAGPCAKFVGLTVKNTFYSFENVYGLRPEDGPTPPQRNAVSAPPHFATRPAREARCLPGRPPARDDHHGLAGAAKDQGEATVPRAKRKHKSAKSRLDVPPGLPSRGSRNHCNGECRPCRDMQLSGCCPCGYMCNFCHFGHDEGSGGHNEGRESSAASSTSTSASGQEQLWSSSSSERLS